MMVKILVRLGIELCIELVKAYRQAKREERLDEIRDNPGAWFSGHFSDRVSKRDNSAAADKAGTKREGDA